MDVPEARIHQAGSGWVPGRYALALDLLLVTKGASDNADDRRPRVRVPAECTVRREPEMLDEEVRMVVLDRSRKRSDVQRRRIDMSCQLTDGNGRGIDHRRVRGAGDADSQDERRDARQHPFKPHRSLPFSPFARAAGPTPPRNRVSTSAP